MPLKGYEKLNFYIEVDGEYIPISDMQEITLEEAEEKMQELNYVRVVKCKDCVYADKEIDAELIKYEDILKNKGLIGVCERHGVYVKADDYCSYGEYKDDADL